VRVKTIGYDNEAEEAYVEYLGGGLYAYRLRRCAGRRIRRTGERESKGTFVNAVIKKYSFREV
jgi:hypothetical protein